jgi:hypothetical protein
MAICGIPDFAHAHPGYELATAAPAGGFFIGRRCMWHLMRQAAIARHYAVWVACGRNRKTWPLHMAMIRAFYGY